MDLKMVSKWMQRILMNLQLQIESIKLAILIVNDDVKNDDMIKFQEVCEKYQIQYSSQPKLFTKDLPPRHPPFERPATPPRLQWVQPCLPPSHHSCSFRQAVSCQIWKGRSHQVLAKSSCGYKAGVSGYQEGNSDKGALRSWTVREIFWDTTMNHYI